MIHYLGYIGKDKNIVLLKVFDDYDVYKNEVKIIKEFSDAVQPFETLTMSFTEYLTLKDDYINESSKIRPAIEPDFSSSFTVKINKALMNFLSSFRSFLDHAETYIKHKFGNGSIEFQHFKEMQSSLYDGYFSYRFLYKYRNYVQHYSMPIKGVTFSAELTKDNIPRHKFSLLISRDILLNSSFDWGKVLKREISNLTSEIDIDKYIIELYPELAKLLGVQVSFLFPKVYQSAVYIKSILEPFAYLTEPVCILQITEDWYKNNPSGQPKQVDVEIEWFPINTINMILQLPSY